MDYREVRRFDWLYIPFCQGGMNLALAPPGAPVDFTAAQKSSSENIFSEHRIIISPMADAEATLGMALYHRHRLEKIVGIWNVVKNTYPPPRKEDDNNNILSRMANRYSPDPAPDLNRNRLPTMFEVLARRTLAPVDLYFFYIYMRDQQRAVDYLDFW